MRKQTLARLKEQIRGVAELRKLFEDPERWTEGTLAEDKDHDSVNARSKRAVRWCMIGGLKKVGLRRDLFGPESSVIDLNDDIRGDDPEFESYIYTDPSVEPVVQDKRIRHRRVMLFLDFQLLALRDEYGRQKRRYNREVTKRG